MKFTSMFFTASDSIFEIYLKDSKKRAKKKQRKVIFFDTGFFSRSFYLCTIHWVQIGENCVNSHTGTIKLLGITRI
jgi:predicted AAA+ superfamily ATPase